MLYFLNHPSEHIYTQENKNSGMLPYTHTYEFAVTAQQLAFVAHMVRALQSQGPVAPWPGGPGGGMAPLLLRPVGKLSMLSEIVKVVDGGGGAFIGKGGGCRKKFSVCRKSTALGPSKNMGPEDLVLHFSQLFLVRS
jgi:hypothetical protein